MRFFLILFILFCSSPSFADFRTVTLNVNMQRPLFAVDCMKCHGGAIDGMEFCKLLSMAPMRAAAVMWISSILKSMQRKSTYRRRSIVVCAIRKKPRNTMEVYIIRRAASTASHATLTSIIWENGIEAKWRLSTSVPPATVRRIMWKVATIRQSSEATRTLRSVPIVMAYMIQRFSMLWGRGYSLEAREFYTKACFKCHGDSALMKKSNLTTVAVETYEETSHGKIRKLGVPSAGCADCHGAHNILPEEDPKSSIHEENLKKICSKCHQGININFTKYIAHPNLSNRERYPLLFWTKVFMFILLLSILVFYWGHTFLWWRKAYWEKQRQLREGILISEKLVHIENPGETYIRFRLRDRLFHLICIFTFFGLAFTGLPIKFPDAQWARFMLNFIGGAEGAILLHRILAFIILVEFFIFLVYCAHFALFNKKRGKTITERLFGPYSFLPRKKDWEDFVAMGKWFVDQGPPPEFDHWTYYEKFDVLAVFWGMVAIGISGVLLWLPEVTAKFIPGWVINIARIIHSEEALLAIGFIFTVHFFNTHFVPTKWPMNYSIFTGRIYKWEFIEERSLEYDRLLESKELEKLKVGFPNILGNLLSGVVGITSLILGLLTLVFIVWAVVY